MDSISSANFEFVCASLAIADTFSRVDLIDLASLSPSFTTSCKVCAKHGIRKPSFCSDNLFNDS